MITIIETNYNFYSALADNRFLILSIIVVYIFISLKSPENKLPQTETLHLCNYLVGDLGV
jgi:hypothetical protein